MHHAQKEKKTSFPLAVTHTWDPVVVEGRRMLLYLSASFVSHTFTIAHTHTTTVTLTSLHDYRLLDGSLQAVVWLALLSLH